MTLASVLPDERGPQTAKTETLYDDAPYARLMVFHYQWADVYWLYVSEHTDPDAIEDLWTHLPKTARFSESEPCARGFGNDATRCVVHTFIARRGELIESSLTPEVFFTSQVMGQLL